MAIAITFSSHSPVQNVTGLLYRLIFGQNSGMPEFDAQSPKRCEAYPRLNPTSKAAQALVESDK